MDYVVVDTLPGYDEEVYGKMHGDMLGPVELPGSLLRRRQRHWVRSWWSMWSREPKYAPVISRGIFNAITGKK